MRSNGTAIIYVSHRLDEVVTLGDRCTVLRDGQTAAVSTRGAFRLADLVEAMTGRGITNPEIPTSAPGPVLLEAVAARPSAIQIRANEVIGLAGAAVAAPVACCTAYSALPARKSRSAAMGYRSGSQIRQTRSGTASVSYLTSAGWAWL